jgi:biotin transport system substrate-specific component
MQSTVPIRLGSSEALDDLGRSATGKVFLAIGASVFVALCAHISIPLYFTPVPITLQTLAVILVGFTLGPALGFSALALYLAEGAAGLPVFSPQGLGGIAQLLGPTGGFLFAYPFAAAAAGFVARTARTARFRFATSILAGCTGSIVILATGGGWLAHLLHVSPATAWRLAVLPFLPGECLKIAIAATAYSSLRRWRQS